MTGEGLKQRLREVVLRDLPHPGGGHTPERHRLLAATARENVGLAKLAEAHWDALAILAEAGRSPQSNAIYAVWASEVPGAPLRLMQTTEGLQIDGTKPFCSGVGLVDRALVTIGGSEQLLVEVDLRRNEAQLDVNLEVWKTDAFRSTQTGSVKFVEAQLDPDARICGPGWYLGRPGFWHGACGPAACWAGGAAGLVDFALGNKRNDAHTLAHLGAMQADVWAMFSLLAEAGREIDASPGDTPAAHIRALRLRHVIEQMASDILQRFSRAYGPHPLCMNEEISSRFREVDLYMRQSHAERDLEELATLLRATPTLRSANPSPIKERGNTRGPDLLAG